MLMPGQPIYQVIYTHSFLNLYIFLLKLCTQYKPSFLSVHIFLCSSLVLYIQCSSLFPLSFFEFLCICCILYSEKKAYNSVLMRASTFYENMIPCYSDQYCSLLKFVGFECDCITQLQTCISTSSWTNSKNLAFLCE